MAKVSTKSTLAKINTSVLGLLRSPPPTSNSRLNNRCEDIREAMLNQCGTDTRASGMANRVCYAKDIEAL